MKYLFSVILIFISKSAFAQQCPPINPIINLSSSVATTQYERNIEAEKLNDMHGSLPEDNSVLGLAGGEVGTKFDVLFDAEPVGDNLYCLNFKKITAVFYAQPKIYLASNFKRGTCEYTAILQHENKHVEVLKKAQREYMPEYRTFISGVIEKLPVLEPIRLQDANAKKQLYINQIGQELAGFMENAMIDVAQRQRAIDTQEEYESVWRRCDRWAKKLDDE